MNDKIVENLLNQMYKESDLKADIFSFIQPYITKAYSLLQQDKLSKDSLGQSVLTNIEQKHMIETIIYRDLPSLIDVYTKLPLEYRNEHILKNGKTHRGLLIENIEILAKKLKQLEHAAYEDINQTLTVKSRLIKEKYGDDSQYIQLDRNLQVETEQEQVNSTYNWNVEKNKILNSDKTIFEKEIVPSKKGFVIKNGQIQATLGSKIKNHCLVQGQKLMKVLKSKNVQYGLEKFGQFAGTILGYGLVFVIVTAPFTVIVGTLYYDYSQDAGGRHMEKMKQILDVNKELKEVSLKTLAKYAQENELKINVDGANNKVTLVQSLDKDKCENMFSYMQKNHTVQDWQYNVNGVNYSSKMAIAPENIDTICNYESNKVVNTVPYL